MRPSRAMVWASVDRSAYRVGAAPHHAAGQKGFGGGGLLASIPHDLLCLKTRRGFRLNVSSDSVVIRSLVEGVK